MRKKTKLNVLSAVAITGMLLSATPVFAATGDYYDRNTNTKYSVSDLSDGERAELEAAYVAGNEFYKELSGGNFLDYSAAEDKIEELIVDGTPIDEILSTVRADNSLFPEVDPSQFEDADPGEEIELAVESVSAINKTGVTVGFPEVTELQEDVTIAIIDNNGVEVAVNAQDIAVGATSATFTFTTALTADPTGVWTVAGVEYDFADIKLVADIKAANIVQLAQLLNNEAKFTTYIEENIDLYHAEKEKPAVKSALNTVKDVQTLVIDVVNKAEVGTAEFDAFANEFKEAKTQLAKFSLLKTNFLRVHDTDMAAIMDTTTSPILVKVDTDVIVIDSTKAATMDAIQDVVDTLNLENAKTKVDALDAATFDSEPSKIVEAKALVVALVDNDDINVSGETKVDLEAAIKALEEKIDGSLEAAKAPVKAAEEAMAAYIAAGGVEADEEYEAVKVILDELAKEDLSSKAIDAQVTLLGDGTDDKAINDLLDAIAQKTVLADADVALNAFIAAGGKNDDVKYTDVTDAVTAYDPTDDGTTYTALDSAITALKTETVKLEAIKAVVNAKTVDSMVEAIFVLETQSATVTSFDDFVVLSSDLQMEVAGALLKVVDRSDLTKIETGLSAAITEISDIVSDINEATDKTTMIANIKTLTVGGETPYSAISAQKVSAAADTLLAQKPEGGYKTSGAILDIIEVAIQ